MNLKIVRLSNVGTDLSYVGLSWAVVESETEELVAAFDTEAHAKLFLDAKRLEAFNDEDEIPF